jgi:tagatose-6-phosphate ketose/aldose isomerase
MYKRKIMSSLENFYGKDASFFASRNCSFTAGEIAQQPDVWRELCQILESKKADIAGFFGRAGASAKRRIILSGAGSSAFVGEAASYALGNYNAVHCEAVHTTDIVSSPYSVLFKDEPALLVSFGRSGNSPESTGAIRYARSIVKDLYEAALVCDGKSSLARVTAESDKSFSLILPEKTNDKGFAMTSSFTSMLLACMGFFNYEKMEEVTADIRLLADNLEKQGPLLSKTAEKWAGKDYRRLIVLGSGCCKALAKEAALKSLELSMGAVNAASESAMGFRHGPKSAIKDDTLTVHFISDDAFTALYDLDLLKEISSQRKQNRVIVMSGKSVPVETDENIIVPSAYRSASDLYRGINSLVFCQLLAMYKSIALDLPVDNPSVNGELNRVVEGFTVYDLGGSR